MKFIKRVILENFQSHKYSIVDFNEGLNVIVGPSDSGKSAIIRGIKWALYNEPSGDYFIREGSTECSVTLEFNDNVILKRYRSKYKNTYILTDRDGKEIKFEGFGSSVPQEIIETVGIKKINLDSDSSNAINLGEQLEGAFLLSEKTSVRASGIGRLVGVNIVDDALKDVLKDNRNLNINKKNIEENIQRLEVEIENFDYLDALKLKFNRLDNLKTKLVELENKVEILNRLRNNLNDIKIEYEEQSMILKKLGQIDIVNEIINAIDNKTYKYKTLNNFYNNLKNIVNRISDCNFVIENLKNVDAVRDKISRLESLCNNEDKYRRINDRYIELVTEKSTLLHTIKKLDNLQFIDTKLTDMSSKYNRLRDLDAIKIKYDNILKSISIGNEYLQRFKYIDKCSKNITLLQEKASLLSNYLKYYDNLLINSDEISKELKTLKSINITIDTSLNKYQELLKEVEICPFCLSDINDDKIEHIINHYIGG